MHGRELLAGIGPLPAPLHLIMDAAYDDNTTLQLLLDFGYIPVEEWYSLPDQLAVYSISHRQHRGVGIGK